MTQNDKPNDGGPAFPCSNPVVCGPAKFNGMTLRDYFAGQALAGMWANEVYIRTVAEQYKIDNRSPSMSMAMCAYEQADAMLAARDARREDK